MILPSITGIWRYIGAGLVALALIAAIVGGVRSCKKIDQQQENALVESGVTKERSQAQSEVINHVEDARDAVDNPTVNELNVVCEKYDRNCKNSQ